QSPPYWSRAWRGPAATSPGLSIQSSDLAGKRLDLLREILPNLRRLAILANVSNPGSALELSEAEAAARTLGLDVTRLEIRRAEDIAPAFEDIKGRDWVATSTGTDCTHSARFDLTRGRSLQRRDC